MARFNFGYDEKLVGLGEPVQMPADSVCVACNDEYSERELVKGKCVHCRLYAHYTKHTPLEVRAGRERVDVYPTVDRFEDITVERKEREV